MSDFIQVDESPNAMRKAKEALVEKFKNNVNARKKREKKIRKVVDGRTLAKTGRVEQLNVRVTEDVKQLVISAAAARGHPHRGAYRAHHSRRLGEQAEA